jgi:hypothetical protein
MRSALLIGPQCALEAYRRLALTRCTLCRYRHKVHYAEDVIMPIPRRELARSFRSGFVLSA